MHKDQNVVEDWVLSVFEERSRLNQDLKALGNKIIGFAEEISSCFNRNGKVFFCGNGGSAADSEHLAAELVGKFRRERKALPAIAITVNPCILTAVSNDGSFTDVFARQVQALVRKGDLLIGISTSGNSINVLRAIREAKKVGARTAALLGNGGGKIKVAVDRAIVVPSKDTPRIQEAHITIGHIVCELVEKWVIERKKLL